MADGPVSFAWFMEQALYHPEHGYYSSGRAKLGRRGDYFTNVSVGAVFGKLVAGQFAEIWRVLGSPTPFTVVEQGAHHGDFAGDVLRALKQTCPECYAQLRYVIIEPFTSLRETQEQCLADFIDCVAWESSLDAIEPFVGVHFSNELLDAMPVHLVRSQG